MNTTHWIYAATPSAWMGAAGGLPREVSGRIDQQVRRHATMQRAAGGRGAPVVIAVTPAVARLLDDVLDGGRVVGRSVTTSCGSARSRRR